MIYNSVYEWIEQLIRATDMCIDVYCKKRTSCWAVNMLCCKYNSLLLLFYFIDLKMYNLLTFHGINHVMPKTVA